MKINVDYVLDRKVLDEMPQPYIFFFLLLFCFRFVVVDFLLLVVDIAACELVAVFTLFLFRTLLTTCSTKVPYQSFSFLFASCFACGFLLLMVLNFECCCCCFVLNS